MKRKLGILAILGFAVLLFNPSSTWAQAYLGPNLNPFAVLGGSTVTSTGNSVITGDLGLYPGPSVTGFAIPPANTVLEGPGSTGLVNGPGLVSGTIFISHATADLAQGDLTTAFNTLTTVSPCADLTGTDLGGLTLTPGVYCFSTSAQLTGILTLNALGAADSVWVFRIGSTLTTAPGSSVVFINGSDANSCGVQWRVGTAATIDTTTQFKGNVLAQDSISMNNGANLIGRALARTGAVTLINNNISFATCGAGGGTGAAPPPFPGVPGTATPGTGTPTPVPTLPGWAILMLTALLALAGLAAMRRRAL